LSEIVYKGQDVGHEVAEHAMRRLESLLPVDVKLSKLHWGRAGKHQVYIVAETADVLYCAFLGTKSPRDILTSFNYKGNKKYLPELKLHQGYVARAVVVPAEQLWRLATARGKRLVFTGHSMGGAIAHLCTLRLLNQLPEDLHYTVRSIGFATPLLGEAAVAEAIAEKGWAKALKNYLVPEDWVPDAMNLWQPHVILDAVTHGATSNSMSSTTANANANEAAVAATTAAAVEADIEKGQILKGSIKRNRTTPIPYPRSSETEDFSRILAKRKLTQPSEEQRQQHQKHQNNAAVFKVRLALLEKKAAISTRATWVTSTLSVLISIALRAGDIALMIPRIFAPRYVHLGQQVYLSRRISREPLNNKYNVTATSATNINNSTITFNGGTADTVTISTAKETSTSTTAINTDKLVPLMVKPSLISNHRMITYRLRMIQLYDYQVAAAY
jgi:hypothetical protein